LIIADFRQAASNPQYVSFTAAIVLLINFHRWHLAATKLKRGRESVKKKSRKEVGESRMSTAAESAAQFLKLELLP
jgi:hypothetical protein